MRLFLGGLIGWLYSPVNYLEIEKGMTMDVDEWHSGLNLACQRPIAKLIASQLSPLLGVYMISPLANSHLL